MLRHRQRMRESSTLPSPPSCPTISVATRTADNELLRNAPMRYARGMRRLFDHIPKAQYHSVRYDVMNVFSSERAFYYAQKGDQLISPEQQAEITTIFNEYELPAPQFDSYEQRPDWEQ